MAKHVRTALSSVLLVALAAMCLGSCASNPLNDPPAATSTMHYLEGEVPGRIWFECCAEGNATTLPWDAQSRQDKENFSAKIRALSPSGSDKYLGVAIIFVSRDESARELAMAGAIQMLHGIPDAHWVLGAANFVLGAASMAEAEKTATEFDLSYLMRLPEYAEQMTYQLKVRLSGTAKQRPVLEAVVTLHTEDGIPAYTFQSIGQRKTQ